MNNINKTDFEDTTKKSDIKTEKHGKISSSVNKCVRASGFYNFFRSYYKSENNFSKSLSGSLLSSEKLGAWVRIFKNLLSKSCETSLIVNAISAFYRKLINCSIRSYAVVALYFGFYALIIQIIKSAISGIYDILPDNAYYATIMILIALIFMPFKCSLRQFAAQSRILSFFSEKIFIKSYTPEKRVEVYHPFHGILILAGALFGILTLFLPVQSIVISVISILLIISFFKIPENSLPVLIISCPFLQQGLFCFLCVTSFCAYLFKVLRGKRNFSMKYFDVLIILFFVIMIVGGFSSNNRTVFNPETASVISVCLVYFSIRNCVRNELQCRKIAYSFVVCALISSLILIYAKVHSLGVVSVIEQRSMLRLNAAPVDPFGSKIVFSEFLLVFLPFVLMSSIVTRNFKSKMASIFSIVSCAAALVFADSKGILLAFGVCLLIYITSSFKNPFASLITIIVVYALVSLFLTQSAFLGDDRFFSIHGYKEMIINSSLGIASDNLIGGIGFGKVNFADVFSAYNGFSSGNITSCYNMYLQLLIQTGIFGFLYFVIISVYYFKMQFSCISDNKHKSAFSSLVAISSISSVGTVFVRGLTNAVWNDHRVLFAFFAVIGLSVAVYRFNSGETNAYNED